jgi:hypothetical protein
MRVLFFPIPTPIPILNSIVISSRALMSVDRKPAAEEDRGEDEAEKARELERCEQVALEHTKVTSVGSDVFDQRHSTQRTESARWKVVEDEKEEEGEEEAFAAFTVDLCFHPKFIIPHEWTHHQPFRFPRQRPLTSLTA